MTNQEHELELLEMWLDGELPVDEAAALEARLAGDSALTARVQSLRSDRRQRAAWMASLEGSASEVDAIVRSMRKLAVREQVESVWTARAGRWRRWSAAAACLLIGLMVGWMARNNYLHDTGRLQDFVAPGSAGRAVDVADRPQLPRAVPVYLSAPWPDRGGYSVSILDASGRVIDIKRFSTLDEATLFSRGQPAGPAEPGSTQPVRP